MSFGRAGLGRSIRPFIVLVAVSVALVIGSHSVLGAEVVSKSGKRGVWTLRDAEAQPGAFCTYGIDGNPSDGQLDLIEARSPRVFARNRTSRRDGQWVGIRIQFQKSRQDGGQGGWETVKSTGFVKKFARDDQAVAIGQRAWHASYDGMPQFRVRANIRWYRPGTKSVVAGAATLAYEWYEGGGGSGTSEGYPDKCLPE
jgi:hypothetical protein